MGYSSLAILGRLASLARSLGLDVQKNKILDVLDGR